MIEHYIQAGLSRRDYWYDRLHTWFNQSELSSPPKPTLQIVSIPIGRKIIGGQYCRRTNVIELNFISFVMGHWDATLGHEMVHAFQLHAMPKALHHGETFHLLMKAMKLPTGSAHWNWKAYKGHQQALTEFSRNLPRLIYDETRLAQAVGPAT